MKSLEYYLSLPYKMVIVPDKTEGGYTAYYPDLPGCATCSDNPDDIVRLAEDAKRSWLIAAMEDVGDIPEPSCNNE